LSGIAGTIREFFTRILADALERTSDQLSLDEVKLVRTQKFSGKAKAPPTLNRK
jgi:hypothetical protein